MGTGNTQKGADVLALDFEAQLWAAAGQAVPALNCKINKSAAKSQDVLGHVYEYFLGKFASGEGKGGGEFYTPQCVVQMLVAMLGRQNASDALFGGALRLRDRIILGIPQLLCIGTIVAKQLSANWN